MYSEDEKNTMKARILEEMTGPECRSLENILKNDVLGEFPGKTTVYGWLQKGHKDFDPDFLNDYERARDIRADKMFEEMLDISDTTKLGETTKISDDGVEITRSDMIAHRKLQIDTRKWILSRMKPKKYGDKIETTIQGGENPVKRVDVTQLSDEALEEIAKQADANKPKS